MVEERFSRWTLWVAIIKILSNCLISIFDCSSKLLSKIPSPWRDRNCPKPSDNRRTAIELKSPVSYFIGVNQNGRFPLASSVGNPHNLPRLGAQPVRDAVGSKPKQENHPCRVEQEQNVLNPTPSLPKPQWI
jgi:hypothetical protein